MKNIQIKKSAHSPVALDYAAKKLGIGLETLLHCCERGDFACERDEEGNILEVYLPGKEPLPAAPEAEVLAFGTISPEEIAELQKIMDASAEPKAGK